MKLILLPRAPSAMVTVSRPSATVTSDQPSSQRWSVVGDPSTTGVPSTFTLSRPRRALASPETTWTR
jgi:hypothetical protein